MYNEIRRITFDRKARGAGYHQMDEYEKSKNMAREAKYRYQELALASMSQMNAISGMVQSNRGYGYSLGGGGYYGGNSGRVHVRGHYNGGHWVQPYTRSR